MGYIDRAYYGSSLTTSKDVSPYGAEQNLTSVEISDFTNTKYVQVGMDMYATILY